MKERVIICQAERKMYATQVHPNLAVLSKGPLIIKRVRRGEKIETENVHNLIYLRPEKESRNKPFRCPDCPIKNKRCQIIFSTA